MIELKIQWHEKLIHIKGIETQVTLQMIMYGSTEKYGYT